MKIIESDDFFKLKKEIKKLKENEIIVVKAKDENFNKKIIESSHKLIILGLEFSNKEDFLKQRNSGLNEYLAKTAKKTNKIIAIDLDSFLKLDKKNKAKILARIIQNINLCKKYKTKMILWPIEKYSKLEIISFFKSLNGSTEQAKIAYETSKSLLKNKF